MPLASPGKPASLPARHLRMTLRALPTTLFLFALMLVAPAARAAEPAEWMTDFAAAQARAAAEHKPLLVLFTGSTWCPPCLALHEEVLGTADFAALARDHILVQLDYPAVEERTPAKVATDLALARRMALKRRHAVAGFPTVIIFSPEGVEQTRRVGYARGAGAARYLSLLGADRVGE